MNRRRTELETICRKHGVAILYSFGSRARETLAWLDDPEAALAPGPSDVDLGAKPRQDVDFNWKVQVALEQALEDLLRVARVDLVNLHEANPFLAAEVVHGERLYARANTRPTTTTSTSWGKRAISLTSRKSKPVFFSVYQSEPDLSLSRRVVVKRISALDPGQPAQDRSPLDRCRWTRLNTPPFPST